jgi:predicted metalloprotease
LETHLNDLMACLVRAWQPPVTAAGYQIVRPSVTIYGDSITTKCGKADGGNAFYCPADQQVYYSRTLPQAVADLQGSKWGPDLVLAHEFGHAIQARTGILIAANGLEQQAGDKTPEGLQISRRIETQADCFSGLFLRSTSQSLGITQADVPAMEVIFVAIGDDSLSRNPDIESTHGRGSSRLYWARQGLGTSSVGKCDTFTAAADLVK